MRNRQHNRRQHFRLPYPPGAGPLLVSCERTFIVVELSERGLQVVVDTHALVAGERLSGILHFPDDCDTAVKGVVLRIYERRAVLRLVDGIGLDRMVSEQKRILRAYPEFLRPKDV